jgi:hypothetical protein
MNKVRNLLRFSEISDELIEIVKLNTSLHKMRGQILRCENIRINSDLMKDFILPFDSTEFVNFVKRVNEKKQNLIKESQEIKRNINEEFFSNHLHAFRIIIYRESFGQFPHDQYAILKDRLPFQQNTTVPSSYNDSINFISIFHRHSRFQNLFDHFTLSSHYSIKRLYELLKPYNVILDSGKMIMHWFLRDCQLTFVMTTYEMPVFIIQTKHSGTNRELQFDSFRFFLQNLVSRGLLRVDYICENCGSLSIKGNTEKMNGKYFCSFICYKMGL